MGTSVFPTFAGTTFPVQRTPMWDTQVQTSVSGKEVRQAFWTYPIYQWDLSINLLRSDSVNAEFQALMGFFNARQGKFDTFLYQDADDNSITGQVIGVGDGSTTNFPLVKDLGGFVEPILAPNVVSHVYVNGVDPGGWSVTNWGTISPGLISFGTAPANGTTISADFTYYYPCRFLDDKLQFSLFMTQFYSAKKVSWQSVKN